MACAVAVLIMAMSLSGCSTSSVPGADGGEPADGGPLLSPNAVCIRATTSLDAARERLGGCGSGPPACANRFLPESDVEACEALRASAATCAELDGAACWFAPTGAP